MAQDDETTAAQVHAPAALPAQRNGEDDTDRTSVVHELLAEHVPLALLVDLVAPGVSSEEILKEEGLPEEPWWEPEADVPLD